jgi:DNA-binding HxlR family transcriptional regulator
MKLDKSKWNGCPVRYSAKIIGDKWTFIILRDLMFRGKSRYSDLLKSSEKISTNILANKLVKMEQDGLLFKRRDEDNRRNSIYQLTDKGKDLMPALLKLFEWSYKYDENTLLNHDVVDQLQNDTQVMVDKIRTGKVLVLGSDEV